MSLGPPIFILGNPRSGTTLLRLMLTCHREILIPPECGFAVWLYDKYREWSPSRVGRFVEDVVAAKKFDTWGVDASQLATFVEDRQPATYAEAASLIYEFYGRTLGRNFSRWGDKNNFYIDHIETIHEIYPRAVFVHIVRDGRNVACSYKQLHVASLETRYAPQLPWQMEDVAAEWKANNDRIESGLSALESRLRVRVRFEDLVSEPEAQLRTLCEALGEDFDPGMLDYHRTNAERQLEPKELLPWKQKTLRPLIRSEIDRYRRELDMEEIAAFERVAGSVLQRYGYQVSHEH